MNKIVWLTNITLPIFTDLIHDHKLIENGSWMSSLFLELDKNANIELHIFSPSQHFTSPHEFKFKQHFIYLFPQTKQDLVKYPKHLESYFSNILSKIGPKIIHCHGTEYPHTLALLNVSNKFKKIVSLQGIISEYSKVYFGNLNIFKLMFYTLISPNSIFIKFIKFNKRIRFEHISLRKADIILGRTLWDYDFTKSLNLGFKYRFMPEFPLEHFYLKKWSYSNSIPHTILFTQATYPIKGFHVLLSSLIELIKLFPDTKVYISGRKQYKEKYSFFDYLKLDEYDKYIFNYIKKNKLFKHLSFVGELSSLEICEQMLRSNIYINTSHIENSPNSLAEAILLGIPVISSNVGGVKSLSKESNFVTFDINDSNQLTQKIVEAFNTFKTNYTQPNSFNKNLAVKNIFEYYEIQ